MAATRPLFCTACDGWPAAEFLADPCIEELADVLEVVYALAGAIGVSRDALEIARREKAEARGGFQARVFLIETD